MTLPGQQLTLRDGGIGVSAPAADKFLIVGPSSLGTANTLYTVAKPQSITDALGYGQAPDVGRRILELAGGSLDILKTAASVAAANSAVTASGGGPAVTVAGTATNFYSFLGRIQLGGALGAGKFDYSLDGGKNFSEVFTIPSGGTFLLPNTGLTLTFPAGTYVLGETYTFTSTPATFNATDLTNAWVTALASSTSWPVIVFAGQAATGAAAATLAGTITTLLTQLANQFRYGRALVDAGNEAAAAIITAWSAVTDPRICVTFGRCRQALGSGFAGWGTPSLPFLYAFASRAAQVKLSTNPAWRGFPAGALEGCTEPSFDEFKNGELLHPAKINAPTTDPGSNAVWPVNALLKSGASSDFKFLQWGRVIDRGCGVIQQGQQFYVHSSPDALTDGTGRIDPIVAGQINTRIRGLLEQALVDPINDEGRKGHVSGFEYAVDETNDILGSSLLQSSASFVPKPNVSNIATDVGFARSVG